MNLYSILTWVLSTLSGFLCMQVLGILLPVGKEKWKKIVLFFGCWLLSSMVIFMGDLENLPPAFLVFIAVVFICCGGTKLQKLTIGMMIASTAFAFSALIDNYILFRFFVWNPTPLRTVFWLAVFLLMRHFSMPRDYELSPALWKLLLLLTVTPFGIVLSLVLLRSPYYETTRDSQFSDFVLFVLAVLSFVGLLWAVAVLARQRRLEQQKQLYEINKAYYENIEQQQFEVRRLRHDLANHLQILMGLPDELKNAYIKELVQLPTLQSRLHYCENTVVNAVINAKTDLMEQIKITFTHQVSIPESSCMEKMDLCALFANSMDNAIEACRKLPANSRKITVEAKAEKGLLVYRISNSLPEPLKMKDDLPMTSKKDRTLKGIGLKSIREIVTRYNGHFEIETTDGNFTLFLYLPFHS